MKSRTSSIATFVSVLLFTAFLFSNHQSVAKKYKFFILSAPHKFLSGVERVAIFDFEGSRDVRSSIVDKMNKYLLQSRRGYSGGSLYLNGLRTNIYKVIDRKELDRVMQELRFGASGWVDENRAKEAGKMLGVDAIIVGNVNYSYNDKDKTHTYKRKDGSTYNSYCRTRTVVMNSTIKIISVESGELLGTYETSDSKKDTECDDKRQNLMSVQSLAQQAMSDVAWRLVNYFTPVFYRKTYEIQKFKNKSYKNQEKQTFEFLELGDIKNAFKTIKSVYDKDSYNPRLAFNLGVLCEVTGNYEDAIKYYDRAYSLEPKRDYLDSKKRSMGAKSVANWLKSRGVVLTPMPLESVSPTSMRKVKIKGNYKSRIKIFEKPDANGNVIQQVPGGLEFQLIEKTGQWFKIDLLDGESGYVRASEASLN